MYVFEQILIYLILAFTVILCTTYVLLGLISAYQLSFYKRTNKNVDYNTILSSPHAPGISILAPAYNESATIIDNIKALLSIHYNKFEVIVINDGSKDDSLEKVIKEFQLEKVEFAVNHRLKCKEIKGIYKSKDKAYKFLTVVDKENGGKADALNTGLNISEYGLFIAIDVDSVIDPNALLKMVKPFMDTHKERVIATGGTIRIANSCKIENGHIVEINVPKNILARFQVVEYTRSFLMGRIAWSKLNGLLLISGALGLFDKDIAIEAGGYDSNLVGEDMELVVRMRRYMYERKEKHLVEYIPDPLCWTEVPTNLNTLERQRNRWTRGTMESLFSHKRLFLNPRYGSLGMMGYPYWFFFEWLAPILEVVGYIYFAYLAFIGAINWPFFLLLFAFAYTFGVSFSIYSLMYEEYSYHKYRNLGQILKLILIAFFEPITFHYIQLVYAIRGNFSYLVGNKSWGNMEHHGFKDVNKNKNNEVNTAAPVAN